MNTMRKWVVLLCALCATLPMLAVHADAQDHDRGDRRERRVFIGTYRRTKPGRDGDVHYFMNIGRDGRAEETVKRSRDRAIELRGNWDVHDRLLSVTLHRPGGDRDETRTYRLDGRNLIQTDDPHIFYKKQ